MLRFVFANSKDVPWVAFGAGPEVLFVLFENSKE
jgi:hypothetical protein